MAVAARKAVEIEVAVEVPVVAMVEGLPVAVPLPSDFRTKYRTSRHPPLGLHILYNMP